MKELPSREAKNSFGDLIHGTQTEPVCIKKYGQPVAVILSYAEYKRMEFAEKALMSQMGGLSAEAFKNSTSLLEQLRKHSPVLKAIVKKYGGSNLRVFGSVAREEESISSDVDLLVDFSSEQSAEAAYHSLGLGASLEDIIGRKVDIVSLAKLNPQIKEEALKEAIIL